MISELLLWAFSKTRELQETPFSRRWKLNRVHSQLSCGTECFSQEVWRLQETCNNRSRQSSLSISRQNHDISCQRYLDFAYASTEKLTNVKQPEGTCQQGVRRIQHASKHVEEALKRWELWNILGTLTPNSTTLTERWKEQKTSKCTSWATIECSSSSSGAASPLQLNSVHSSHTVM